MGKMIRSACGSNRRFQIKKKKTYKIDSSLFILLKSVSAAKFGVQVKGF